MPAEFSRSNPPEIFISYAHDDEKLKNRFVKHLAGLEQERVIVAWHDRKIVAGDDWEDETRKHLETAALVVLLVSENFLASGFAYGKEFQRALERHQRREARVIPVILSPCDWRNTPLGQLQALPQDGKPVSQWRPTAAGFANVIEGLREAIKQPSRKERVGESGHDITTVTLTLSGSPANFNLKEFKDYLQESLGVALDRIKISIHKGSIKIVLEGDPEELARIIKILGDPTRQREVSEEPGLESIDYVQGGMHHTVRVATAPTKDPVTPIKILREATRAVPAVKFAFGVLGILAAAVIGRAFISDYRAGLVVVVGMLFLMFGLKLFSEFAKYSPASLKYPVLALAWVCVFLLATSWIFIFSVVVFQFPKPLEEYFQRPTPTPTPTTVSTDLPGALEIIITQVPPYDPVGGANSTAHIAGKVSGVRPGNYKVVIYSFTIMWYVQPTTVEPKTEIDPNGTWQATIQLGSKYSALLVPNDYNPPYTTSKEPTRMGGVVAATQVQGK